MRVFGVPSDLLPEYASGASVSLAPALERSGALYSVKDILERCRDGRMQLWVAEEGGEVVAALVSSIQEYPRKRVLEANFCGGSLMDEWLPQIKELLERFGRAHGCDLFIVIGRRGWMKKFPDYENRDMILRKDAQ